MEQVKKRANPSCLGLLGFGMTTVLLNFHNAGLTSLSVVIAAMGLTVGGISQIIAGIMEFKEGNTFGATAFTAYGFFWLSLVFIWWNPIGNLAAGDSTSMGIYLVLWGIFTGFMFIGTLKHNTITKIVFATLTVLFFMLAIADFSGVEAIKVVAGYVGILCGLSAIYSSVAQMVNSEFDRKIFPL